MQEYTILVGISLLIAIALDFGLGTRLLLRPRFWFFYVFVLILQTIVDNYLNGRWWFNDPIVGPYGAQFYSGIKIWHTPLENYFYGFSLVTSAIVLIEWRIKRMGVSSKTDSN